MPRPLRVLFAIPSFDRLGAQRVAVWITQSLDRARVAPSFLVHEAVGDMAKDVPDDVPVIAIDDRALQVPGLRAFTRLPGYLSALRDDPPDVAIGVVQYPSLALAWAKQRLGASWKLVCCEHSFVSKNLADSEAYPPHFRLYYRRRFPQIYNEVADRVLVATEEGRDDLCHSFGIDPGRIVIIPNPIDRERVQRLSREPLEDAWLPREGRPVAGQIPVIVAAGRFVAQKRFDLLLEAFARLRARRPARLMVLGNGIAEASLRAQAARLGIAGDVRIEDISPPWAAMARASLFALSSEWEAMPMVLVEAMALGCPIVSVACPAGPREMLDDGAGGILVPPGDPEALARGLEQALAEPEAMAVRAAYAARKAERYSVERVCDAYASLAEELCGRAPARAAGEAPHGARGVQEEPA